MHKLYGYVIASLPIFIAVAMPVNVLADDAELAKGKAIYEKACKTCHAPETAPMLKSPLVHDQTAWAARMQEAKDAVKASPDKFKDVNAYFLTQIRNGRGAMVPGAMCVDDSTPDKKCTDADYLAAIKFMSSKE